MLDLMHRAGMRLLDGQALLFGNVLPFLKAGNRTLRPIVNDELEDIGPRIVPGSIEVKFSARYLVEVDLGIENGLSGKIRASEHASERIEDSAAAAHYYGLGIVAQRRLMVVAILSARDVLTRGQHEAAAFEGDVLHRRQPGIAIICGGRAVDGNALGEHVHAQHRHVIFPADHGADAAKRRVEPRHGRAVAETPNQSLRRRWHQLAMLPDQASHTVEEQRGAIERTAISFDTADNGENVGLGRRRCDRLDGFAIKGDGRFIVQPKRVAALRLTKPDGRAERRAFWISPNERLRQNRKPGAASSRLSD